MMQSHRIPSPVREDRETINCRLQYTMQNDNQLSIALYKTKDVCMQQSPAKSTGASHQWFVSEVMKQHQCIVNLGG
jgi:hypothetical protein